MTTFNDISEAASAIVQDLVEWETFVSADKLGLDPRAGRDLVVCNDFVAARLSEVRTLEYYGGFEYVPSECKITVGDAVFYSGYCERVQDCIDFYNSRMNNAS